jgi:NAD+ synthase
MSKTQDCINWIKEYFKDNPDGKAIIGISGGKDSTIAAALCVEALGHDRVVGVMMPQGHQKDIADAIDTCRFLSIPNLTINIGSTFQTLCYEIDMAGDADHISSMEPMIKTNLPARIRMATLYAVAALYPNSRVVNTCNYSEDYVGYSTKFGDAAGDFSPLGNLTVREVLEIGNELGLPKHLVHKAPSDGMCGKTDEDNLGFTYEQLDDHILGTGDVDMETRIKIEHLHYATRHKYEPMPTFSPTLEAIKAIVDLHDDAVMIDPREYAMGGLVNDNNMSGYIGSFTIDPLYHSTPSYDNVNQKALADNIQKVVDTAGCGLLRRNQ